MKKPRSLQLIKTAYFPRDLMKCEGPILFFLGRSNVGKSSLLNALTQTTLAQVSKNPGKTRSINYYRWNENSWLVDLPGYGFAKRSREEREKWQELGYQFFETVPKSSLAFVLADSKRELEEEEFQLLESLIANGFDLRLLWTKCDRLSQSEREKLKRYSAEQEIEKKSLTNAQNTLTCHFISAKSGEGIRELQKDIYYYVQNALQNSKNDRQRPSPGDGD